MQGKNAGCMGGSGYTDSWPGRINDGFYMGDCSKMHSLWGTDMGTVRSCYFDGTVGFRSLFGAHPSFIVCFWPLSYLFTCHEGCQPIDMKFLR